VELIIDFNQKRWKPINIGDVLQQKDSKITFLDGIMTVCGSGSATARHGIGLN